VKRLSIPVDNQLFHDFDTKVPHGIKAALIRSLVRVALDAPPKIMLTIAANEHKPELFEVKERETVS
jgi:hypothetical protein